MTEQSLAASDVAGIALNLPDQIRGADMLAALHQAWRAGYRAGHLQGIHDGQAHVNAVIDLAFKRIPVDL